MLSVITPRLFQFLNCVQVWYNPEGYHSLPAYLNSLNNFILRANLPKNETSRYGKCPFTGAHNSPLCRDILLLLKPMTTLTLTSMRLFIHCSAIPFKAELKEINKS